MPDDTSRSCFVQIDFEGLEPSLRFSRPIRVITAHHLEEVRPAMAAVEAAVADGLYAAGFVAYEAASAFDAALTTSAPVPGLPLVWFGVFTAPDRAAETIADAPIAALQWQPDLSREAHRTGVNAVREVISRGDSYQANYTFRLRSRVEPAGMFPLYQHLRSAQQARYAAFLDLGPWQLLSLSPELFFRVEQRRITTRPMKGTAPRGRWTAEDRERAEALARSEKDRAENVMIVDLARNDVARVADVGSVHARDVFTTERYPSLWQLVSTVEGDVRAGTTVTDVFSALFPAGSITGAPKTSSMRLIAEIEQAPRGAYCGAIGLATPDGRLVFNVAIRTATINVRTGHAEYGVGGGITWDSASDDEYAEALAKAACLTPRPPVDLFETMRLEAGRYVRREAHLKRLIESAGYLDMPIDIPVVHNALDTHAAWHATATRRVRLQLASTGTVTVTSEPFVPAIDATLRAVALARTPVSRHDVTLFHKTTNRRTYDAHRASHPDVFDVLLWNNEEELTEFTIGNLVVELGGERYTPPRACGLLGGVFRQVLLETGRLRERVIRVDELSRATRVWLINSLREWVEVRLSAPSETTATRTRRSHR